MELSATAGAFAALLEGGGVATWGHGALGGDSRQVQSELWEVPREGRGGGGEGRRGGGVEGWRGGGVVGWWGGGVEGWRGGGVVGWWGGGVEGWWGGGVVGWRGGGVVGWWGGGVVGWWGGGVVGWWGGVVVGWWGGGVETSKGCGRERELSADFWSLSAIGATSSDFCTRIKRMTGVWFQAFECARFAYRSQSQVAGCIRRMVADGGLPECGDCRPP